MADNGCGTGRRSRGRYRLTCDVAVDPFQGVGGSKWEHSREHLVQSDAQRVEIAASIDRSIHAPGLFRGHVSKRTGNRFRRCRRLALARQSGRDAKAGEAYVAGAVNEYIFGLDIFVDQTTLVGMAERRCQVNGKAQEMRQIERVFPIPLQNAV